MDIDMDVDDLGLPAEAGAPSRRRLHNYPGRGFLHMTKDEWRHLPRGCKGTWLEGPGNCGYAFHPVRVALIGRRALSPVYIIDARRVEPAAVAAA